MLLCYKFKQSLYSYGVSLNTHAQYLIVLCWQPEQVYRMI